MAALRARLGAMAAAAEPSASTSSQAQKLRVGLFVDTPLQPRWVAEAFTKVAAAEFAEIALIAALGTDAPSGTRAAPGAGPLVWRLYGGLDRLAFGGGEDFDGRVDILGAVQHRRFVRLQPHAPAPDLDVAFALGEFPDEALEGCARYGVWRFFFGADAGCGDSSGTFAAFREVAEGQPLVMSGLRVNLGPGSEPRLAYQSWSRTYPLSVARNRSQLLRKTAEFAWRALRELHRSGEGWIEHCKPLRPAENRGRVPISPSAADERAKDGNRYTSPIFSNAELAGNVARIGARIAQRGMEKALNVEQWFLAYRFREGRFGDARSVEPDLKGFLRLLPPKDRYWADPFALEKNGRHFVFFEELPFRTGKARISMIEIDRGGSASTPVTVLERDYHLSYPFLLEDDGQLYMVPESAANGTVELYRCIDFPLRWKLERVLLEGLRCVDATFHRAADRWWMFANVAAQGARIFDDELHLFHAERLSGKWQPHPRNPVKSDARSARPAGQLYWRNGTLYRPAQICAPLYGSGLSINRVLRLTPHDYAERQVERVLPSAGDGLLGVHTINRAGDLTVIDAFTRRPRF